MDEPLSEAELLGAALLFEQQFGLRARRDPPPWVRERVRSADPAGLVRMARMLVDASWDLFMVLGLTEREFWIAEGVLPGQLDGWARQLSEANLEELFVERSAQIDTESSLRGQRWLLWHELGALENASGIDFGARLKSAHPKLELRFWASRVLEENDVKHVLRVVSAQRLIAEGYVEGVRERLSSTSIREDPVLRIALEQDLAAAISLQQS